MKSKKIFLVNILIVLIIACILVLFIIFNRMTIKAVVVKVGEKYLEIMKLDGTNSNLYDVSYSSDNNAKFKQGQEVLIYYDGFIDQSSSAQISKVKNIKILKEKSSTQIPIDILKKSYNSIDNVSVSIDELSDTDMTISIIDTNKYKYEYSNKYAIYKKQDSWKEVLRISNDKENVLSTYVDNTIIKTYKWENIYGKLDSGEYQLTASTDEKTALHITIRFTIDINGKISYYQPELIIF